MGNSYHRFISVDVVNNYRSYFEFFIGGNFGWGASLNMAFVFRTTAIQCLEYVRLHVDSWSDSYFGACDECLYIAPKPVNN